MDKKASILWCGEYCRSIEQSNLCRDCYFVHTYNISFTNIFQGDKHCIWAAQIESVACEWPKAQDSFRQFFKTLLALVYVPMRNGSGWRTNTILAKVSYFRVSGVLFSC